MEKIEMYVPAGERLDEVYKQLNERYNSEKTYREKYGIIDEFIIYAMFNGKEILHTDTLDEMYVKVTGKTLAEHEAASKAWKEEYDRKEREHKANTPDLIEKYKNEARGVIPENKLELWDKIVPVRLSDLYHGMELSEWLKMIRVLNMNAPKDARFDNAKRIFSNAGHSGMSGALVLSGLRQFHPDGEECAEYIRKAYNE